MKNSFHNPCVYGNNECPQCVKPTTYNKDEVMKAFVTKFPHDTLGYYADHAPADTHSPEDGSCLQCPVQCSYTEDIASFLSTALDAAYKAGEDARNMKIHKTIVDLPYPRDMYVARHRSEILVAIEALK